jgi:hypothetical protein
VCYCYYCVAFDQTYFQHTMDSQLINVILLGLAFMVLFTAFQATGMVEVIFFQYKTIHHRFSFHFKIFSKVCSRVLRMIQLMEQNLKVVAISGECNYVNLHKPTFIAV